MTKKTRNALLLIPSIMLLFVYGALLVKALCTHELLYRIDIIVFSVLSLIFDLWQIGYILKQCQR